MAVVRGWAVIIVLGAVIGAATGCGDPGHSQSSGSTPPTPSRSTASVTTRPSTSAPLTSSSTEPAILTDAQLRGIERRISELLSKPGHQASVGRADVSCPNGAYAEEGEMFDCVIGGTTGPGAPRPGEPLVGTATVALLAPTGAQFSVKYRIEGGGYTYEGTETLFA